MADRVASAAIVADPRKLDGGLKRAQSRFQKFGKNIKTTIGRSIKGAFSGLSTLGGFATVGGLALVGRQVLEFEDSLNRLQIQSKKTPTEIGRLRNQLNAMSKDTGIARDQLLAGANAIINLEGAAGFSAEKLKVLADANLATGTSMEQLAGLTFSLGNAFNLADPASLEKGLSAIITAGKEGAVPLNEMSQVLQQVSASFKELGGTGVQGAADMASALQILRRGFGSAAESGTGLQAMITGLTKKSKQLSEKGIEVFDKNGAFRGIRAILDDFEKADLTFKQLTDTIGRVEGAKAIKTWLEFRRAKIDPSSGKELIGFEELSKAAIKSNAIQEDAAKRRQSDAFKIKKAFNDIKLAFAKAFTPERIKTFVKVVQKLADLLKWMVDNPLKSLGLLFAMKFGPGALGSILSGGSLLGKLAGGGGAAARTAGGSAVAAAGKTGFGLTGKAGLVGAVGIAAFALGTFADKALGLSDKLAGVDDSDARKIEKTKFDPSGRASALREKARQLEAQGVQPGLVAAFRKEAKEIITANIGKAEKRKGKAFEFKKLFGAGPGSIQSRLRGTGENISSTEFDRLSHDEQSQIFEQLKKNRGQARAFAAGAPVQLSRGEGGEIIVRVLVDDDGNLKAENSKNQRKGN